jgi:hemerythrin-like domain-containing protein
MQLLDDLRREHERIDAVVGALRTWALRLRSGQASIDDRQSFLTFFTLYAGTWHHEREEELLFPALGSEAALPVERGPVAVLLEDHRRMAAILRRLADSGEPEAIHQAAVEYSHALWLHIDVENSVLFPESEHQLRRNGVRELASRSATSAENDAASLGDTLIARHPPMQPDIVRGDGCVMCHAYGDGCRGLEREWWNEWEWEEMSEHVAAS